MFVKNFILKDFLRNFSYVLSKDVNNNSSLEIKYVSSESNILIIEIK